MTETGPRPGAGTGLRTGLGQSRAPHAPGAQVDAWDKEEDAVHVTSSTELTPAYPGQVPMTDKGSPNLRCISSLCGARGTSAQRSSHTAQGSRESRTDPGSAGGMLPVGFKAAGDLTLVCGHQESQPKDVLSLAGAGCLQYLASAALSLHLLRYLKQTFFPKSGS